MGDKGGKKDKEKEQKQKAEKQKQKSKMDQVLTEWVKFVNLN